MDRVARRPGDVGKGAKPVINPDRKWTQAESHYRASVEPGGCVACRYYQQGRSACLFVVGTIHDYGCCDYFNEDSHPPAPLSKMDAGYLESRGARFQCGDCRFFTPEGSGSCEIVDGTISPEGACWEWASQDKVGPTSVENASAAVLPSRPPLKISAVTKRLNATGI